MLEEDYKVRKIDSERNEVLVENDYNNLGFNYYNDDYLEIWLDNYNPKHSYIHLTKNEAEELLFRLNDLIGCPMKVR